MLRTHVNFHNVTRREGEVFPKGFGEEETM